MLQSNNTNFVRNKRDKVITNSNPLNIQTMNFKTYSTTHPKFNRILSDLSNTHACESHTRNQHYSFFFKAGSSRLGQCEKVGFG